ncbi:putative Globin-like superfamily protein [Helianthus anomalus]
MDAGNGVGKDAAFRVYDDQEEWFRSIFANSKKEDAIQNQYEFFVQRMGGPPLYSQRKGNHTLTYLQIYIH